MKNALVDKFGIRSEDVQVIKPDIQLPSSDRSSYEKNDTGLFEILYPATFLSYKNHAIIIDALSILKKKLDINNVRFQVTLDEASFRKLYQSAKLLGVEACLENIGYVPQQELYKRYSKSQLVVFPSYLETFGLPLAEAAAFGKRILCSDLPYSRDVLSGYDGAVFVTHDNKSDWADGLESIILNYEEKQFSYKRKIDSNWENLFQLISEKHYV
jgi:glycosyltransferase involved in cell wall biosynthesis